MFQFKPIAFGAQPAPVLPISVAIKASRCLEIYLYCTRAYAEMPRLVATNTVFKLNLRPLHPLFGVRLCFACTPFYFIRPICSGNGTLCNIFCMSGLERCTLATRLIRLDTSLAKLDRLDRRPYLRNNNVRFATLVVPQAPRLIIARHARSLQLGTHWRYYCWFSYPCLYTSRPLYAMFSPVPIRHAIITMCARPNPNLESASCGAGHSLPKPW